jgi:hypothetical protein
MIERWAFTCELDPDPELPQFRTHRIADNLRPLIAIADALGYGAEARAAAIRSFNVGLERNRNLTAAFDIKTVFETAGPPDQMASSELVDTLKKGKFEGDYRGLTQDSLARLLRPLGIRPHPRPLWPSPRLPGSKSFRGYKRTAFERTWELYADDDPSQASQSSNIRYLQGT